MRAHRPRAPLRRHPVADREDARTRRCDLRRRTRCGRRRLLGDQQGVHPRALRGRRGGLRWFRRGQCPRGGGLRTVASLVIIAGAFAFVVIMTAAAMAPSWSPTWATPRSTSLNRQRRNPEKETAHHHSDCRSHCRIGAHRCGDRRRHLAAQLPGGPLEPDRVHCEGSGGLLGSLRRVHHGSRLRHEPDITSMEGKWSVGLSRTSNPSAWTDYRHGATWPRGEGKPGVKPTDITYVFPDAGGAYINIKYGPDNPGCHGQTSPKSRWLTLTKLS